VIDDAVNYPFDSMDWRNFVETTETQKRGHAPPNDWIIGKADDIARAMRPMSRRVARKLERRPAYDPEPGEYVWMEREGQEPLVAKSRENQPKYELQRVDDVGIPHGMGQYRDYQLRSHTKCTQNLSQFEGELGCGVQLLRIAVERILFPQQVVSKLVKPAYL
jgi:hypothetical protein